MVGGTVSRVLSCPDGSLAEGDVVLGYGGWATHSVETVNGVRRLDPDQAPVRTALGVLGMPGFTGWAGLRNIGKPQPGETLVVAAATGPVGSMVGQLARRAGARAVGIAGGPQKKALLTDELGFDAALDRRDDDFADRLAEATPDGIDVYFENVGGSVWDAVLPRLNQSARVPVCGLAAGYNATSAPQGPDRSAALLRRILTRSLLVRGFIVSEFSDQMGQFVREVAPLVADGSIRHLEHVVEGLESAPDAFRGLLVGENLGELLVKVAD